MANDNTVLFEDAKIILRNFEGREEKFNQKGDRNFCVVLDDKTAQEMEEDGWNVKHFKPREEGEEGQPYLPISVSYKHKPPQIWLITNGGKNRTLLDEDTCEMVDIVDIATVDFIVSPYSWGPINDKFGIKAYLKTMFITVAEDALVRKYANLDELPTRSGKVEE